MIDASAVQSSVEEKRQFGCRYDHRFFSAMSVLILIIVFIGFARTYFLAGIFHTRPLPSYIIHIHGAVFTCWILLLVVQTSLVSCHRVAIHRRVGIFGVCLASLMVVLGLLAATDTLKRNAASPNFDAESFYAIPLSELIGFGVPAFFAFSLRRRPSTHKRLILIATIAMMSAAFGRWPVAFLLHRPLPAMLCSFSLFIVLVFYDLVALRRIQLVTISGSTFVILVELMSFPVGHTAAWHAFASWMRSLR
jgi:hypothetical protein